MVSGHEIATSVNERFSATHWLEPELIDSEASHVWLMVTCPRPLVAEEKYQPLEFMPKLMCELWPDVEFVAVKVRMSELNWFAAKAE